MSTAYFSKQRLSILILFIFYLVGLVGISMHIQEDFILLTPMNLLLSTAIVFWNHPRWDTSAYGFVMACFLAGFGIEVLGVQTGMIFGAYQYGPVLGYQFLETPLMIGVNWLLLVYCVGISFNHLLAEKPVAIKAALGAFILLVLDFIIEPVAIHYNFWTWETVNIPIQNYLAWYIIAFLLLLLFYKLIGKQKNKVAIFLLGIQFVFFGVLLFLI